MHRRRVIALIAVLLAAACGKPPSPPADLEQAVAVVGYLASSRYINRSMYSATFETGTPSEFISFLFSSLGAAERPEPSSARQPGASGPPTWPDDVGFHALTPRPGGGKQVVVTADDARGKIIAEGYVDPTAKPVLRREFDMAKPKKPQR
ncbi:MAG: hypothetical protein JNM76_18770 [Betaproteobacteria bacterium]|nr:hypothetical protein [Betaproteobacteria bacterium]